MTDIETALNNLDAGKYEPSMAGSEHTGGSFTAGQGVTARLFGTWDCLWMPLPAAPQLERSE